MFCVVLIEVFLFQDLIHIGVKCQLHFINVCPNQQYNSANDNEHITANFPILQTKLCTKGKHYLILNEEIRVGCKFCSYVKLEMKYVVPEVASHFHCVYDVFIHFFWYDDVYDNKYVCDRIRTPLEGRTEDTKEDSIMKTTCPTMVFIC